MIHLIPLIYFIAMGVAATTFWRSYRNHFLPMAVPIAALSGILMLVCCLQFSLNYLIPANDLLSLKQILGVLGLFLSFLILPLWVSIISEYQLNQKQTIRRYWWLWIEPFIALLVMIFNGVSLPENSQQEVLNKVHIVGAYRQIHQLYMILVGMGVLLWSVHVVRIKTRHNLLSLLQFFACLALPMALFFAYRFGYIERPLGASALVLILVWSAQQSNLLDVIPFALSGVMDKVQAGVMVFNSQKTLVYSNQFANQVLGLKQHHQKSSSLKQLSAELPQQLLSHFDFTLLETQSAQLQLAMQQDSNDIEKTRYIDASLRAINNHSTQQYLGHILLLQDISVRKKSELALTERNQQLNSLNRQKSDFFAGISHEFRTPLTLSLGGLEDVLDGRHGNLNHDTANALEHVKQHNQRLLALVAQLLELSQLNQGAMPLRPQCILLADYLPSISANFESLAAQQHTQIHFINHSSDSTLYFDPDALDKVVTNLLVNALKSIALANNGEILITLFDHNHEYLALSIKDTGHGIPKEILPHIFEAFYSDGKQHEHWPVGTGIGLYLVKQLLGLHHATIQVESDLEHGSEFILLLRKGSQHLPAIKDNDRHQSNIDNTSQQLEALSNFDAENRARYSTPIIEHEKLVLVVEDNMQMRRYIRGHLASNFRLIEAEDGEEGLALATHSVPDLILTDLMMPKLNGLQFSEKIRANTVTSHIPIIMLTAKSEDDDRITGLDAGIDDFLTKPFKAKQLIARIHNLITSREQLKRHYLVDSSHNEQAHELPIKEQQFMHKLEGFVFDNLAHNTIRIADIADYTHMSSRSLNRKLNALTGLSPKQWLLKIRLDKAAKRLDSSDKPITKIALETGFSDSAHFSKTFKNQFGLAPKAYRNRDKSLNMEALK